MVNAIRQVVEQQSEILEAHLPQCYVEGAEAAAQVLVIGVQTAEEIPSVMGSLGSKMGLILDEGNHMDMMPFPVSSLPPAARLVTIKRRPSIGASQKIGEPSGIKPWWKFW